MKHRQVWGLVPLVLSLYTNSYAQEILASPNTATYARLEEDKKKNEVQAKREYEMFFKCSGIDGNADYNIFGSVDYFYIDADGKCKMINHSGGH